MSWIEKLYKTYENHTGAIGSGDIPLLPVCHTTQKAQIAIVIDREGNFQRASVVSKTDARTIIPATEESAGRTSGLVAHPLCDKLQYVAADYVDYGGDKDHGEAGLLTTLTKWTEKKAFNAYKEKLREYSKSHDKEILVDLLLEWIKNNQNDPQMDFVNAYCEFNGEKIIGHALYLSQLKKWHNSNETRQKISAVYRYVSKGHVIQDLVKNGILHCEKPPREVPQLLNQWPEKENVPEIFKLLSGGKDSKGNNKPWQSDAFIRWCVEIPSDPQSNIWNDKDVWMAWEKYYGNLRSQKGFCHVTGDAVVLADQHPAKIRNDGDKAKLISSNDNTGFTFKGRFTDSAEVCGVGFEVTQKAHNALRWLIARQGRRDGGQAIVAWSISGVDVPDPVVDTLSMLFKGQEESIKRDNEYTAQEIGQALSKLIGGYSAKLGSTTEVIVMGLDSATPGRMAICFYRELTGSEFLERVMAWHNLETGCVWRQYFGKDKIFFGAPAPRDIAECVYGKRLDEKLRNATVARLLSCIVDGVRIPRDLVESCVRRASHRQGLEYWEWEKTLGIACALYKYSNKERRYMMALERDRQTRDYLYGRLLAVAEFIEGMALNVAGEGRDTNAARLMQRFADRPYSTWRSIELALMPYKTRLRSKRPGFLAKMEKEHDEIKTLFKTEEYMRDNVLSGEFLIAYHCERKWLWDNTKKGSLENNVIEETNNDEKESSHESEE